MDKTVSSVSPQGWDSYKDFRSSNLNLEISFETKPQDGASSIPRWIVYASLIRWVDRIKMCIDRISRPVRKGRLFGNVKPKKKSLSRHYKLVIQTQSEQSLKCLCKKQITWLLLSKRKSFVMLSQEPATVSLLSNVRQKFLIPSYLEELFPLNKPSLFSDRLKNLP